MALPIYQTSIKELSLLEISWPAQINPVLANTIINGTQLNNIILAVGNNVINHKLQRKYQGWFLTGMRNAWSEVYEIATGNLTLTLTLNSSVVTTVDIWVY